MFYDDMGRIMDSTSTTTTKYDILNEEIPKPENYQIHTNGGKHFEPQSSYPTSTNGGDMSNPNQVIQHP